MNTVFIDVSKFGTYYFGNGKYNYTTETLVSELGNFRRECSSVRVLFIVIIII